MRIELDENFGSLIYKVNDDSAVKISYDSKLKILNVETLITNGFVERLKQFNLERAKELIKESEKVSNFYTTPCNETFDYKNCTKNSSDYINLKKTGNMPILEKAETYVKGNNMHDKLADYMDSLKQCSIDEPNTINDLAKGSKDYNNNSTVKGSSIVEKSNDSYKHETKCSCTPINDLKKMCGLTPIEDKKENE